MGGKWRCLSPPWSLKHRDATLDVHPARLLLRRAGFLGAGGLGRLFEDVRRTHGPVRLAPEQTREGPSPPSSSFCGGRRARDGGKQRRRRPPLGSRWGAAPGSAAPAAPGPAACTRAGGLPLRGAWARNLALVLKRSTGRVNLARM